MFQRALQMEHSLKHRSMSWAPSVSGKGLCTTLSLVAKPRLWVISWLFKDGREKELHSEAILHVSVLADFRSLCFQSFRSERWLSCWESPFLSHGSLVPTLSQYEWREMLLWTFLNGTPSFLIAQNLDLLFTWTWDAVGCLPNLTPVWKLLSMDLGV